MRLVAEVDVGAVENFHREPCERVDWRRLRTGTGAEQEGTGRAGSASPHVPLRGLPVLPAMRPPEPQPSACGRGWACGRGAAGAARRAVAVSELVDHLAGAAVAAARRFAAASCPCRAPATCRRAASRPSRRCGRRASAPGSRPASRTSPPGRGAAVESAWSSRRKSPTTRRPVRPPWPMSVLGYVMRRSSKPVHEPTTRLRRHGHEPAVGVLLRRAGLAGEVEGQHAGEAAEAAARAALMTPRMASNMV